MRFPHSLTLRAVPHFAVLLVLVCLGALAPVRAASGYHRDTHYAWTYYLALHTGFTERQAHQIASAAQTVEEDTDTLPLAARVSGIVRASDELRADPDIRAMWRKHHCFADHTLAEAEGRLGWGVRSDGEVEAARRSRAAVLWDLAAVQGNPGVLVHYEQACFAHREFADLGGHAWTANAPEWLSADRDRARAMTKRTLEVLERFRREVLGEEPVDVDRERIFGVLDQLIDASPTERTGIVLPGGPPRALAWFDAHLEGRTDEEIIADWDAIEAAYAEAFDPGLPSFDTAVRVLSMAIREDKVAGRLPSFPEEWWDPLPSAWLGYDLDAEGRLATDPGEKEDPPPTSLEAIALVVVPEEPPHWRVRIREPSKNAADRLYVIQLALSYELTGVEEMPPLGGVPVREECTVSDTGAATVWKSIRPNGVHTLERSLSRAADELRSAITWTCAIQVQGLVPVTVELTVPPVDEATLAREVPEVPPGELKPALDSLLLVRDEAMASAGALASACDHLGAMGKGARVTLREIERRMRRVERALGTLEHSTAVVGQQADDARRLHDEAEAAVPRSGGARAALSASLDHVCEVSEALASATELQQVYALHGEGTRAQEAEERARARLVELVQTARTNAARTAVIRDDMAELEAGARRLQDAVWSLDPALLAVERFAADAGRVGTERRPLEEELFELETRASTALEDARLAQEELGKSPANKAQFRAIRGLQAEVATAHRKYSGCIEREQKQLGELVSDVHEVGGDAADLAARQAVAAGALPDSTLILELVHRSLAARAAATAVAPLEAEAGTLHERAQVCVTRTAEAYALQTSPAGQVALLDCSHLPRRAPRWNERAERAQCECARGYEWNNAGTDCRVQHEIQVADKDCAHAPGTVPVWDGDLERPMCRCPDGTRYNGGCGDTEGSQP
ncbi:MAG: hypothetical protein JRI25_10435 [Deltaproteobacteria bacterium]|nr:hypothetical protein [Deltaproteobacteria bacterium]